MFIFETDYEFEWPVKVIYPGQSGDEERSFTAVFRMPEDEEDIFATFQGMDMAKALQASRAHVGRYFVGWKGIETPDGAELPVSDENKERLLKMRPIRMAVDRAFAEAVVRGGLREKN